MTALVKQQAVVTAIVNRTGASTYADIAGCTIASGSLTAGKKYLVVAHGVVKGNSSGGQFGIRMKHGATIFPGSEMVIEPASGLNGNWYTYFKPRVWTAVGGEALALEFRTALTGDTVSFDNGGITVYKLSDDLVEGVDWFYDEDASGATLTPTWVAGAEVTFTPSNPSTWMVLTDCQHDVSSLVVSYETRLSRSGEAASLTPLATREGENATEELMGQPLARAFALGVASNTFREESRIHDTGLGSETRLFSAVFALNLNKFRNFNVGYTEASVDLVAADFGNQLQTLALTPTIASDTFILGAYLYNDGSASDSTKARVQVDNAASIWDTDLYEESRRADTRDRTPVFRHLSPNLTAAAHTIDLDASCVTVLAGRSALQRTLIAFTLELAAGAAAGTVSPGGLEMAMEIPLGLDGWDASAVPDEAVQTPMELGVPTFAIVNAPLEGNPSVDINFTVASVIMGARDRHSSFSPDRHPDPILVRYLDRYQRELLAKAIEVNSSFSAASFTVALPLADFEAGAVLPFAYHQIHGGQVRFEDGGVSPFSLVPEGQRFDHTRFYAGWVHGDRIYFQGEDADWTGVSGVELSYVPTTSRLTALRSVFQLPRSSESCLVESCAAFMAARKHTDPQIPAVDETAFWTRAAAAETAWLTEIANRRRPVIKRIRDVM